MDPPTGVNRLNGIKLWLLDMINVMVDLGKQEKKVNYVMLTISDMLV